MAKLNKESKEPLESQSRLESMIIALKDAFETRLSSLETALSEGLSSNEKSSRDQLSSLETKLTARLSSIEERTRDLETDKWFARTIGTTDYRPEIRSRESAGDRLLEYRDSFSRYSSPYRR